MIRRCDVSPYVVIPDGLDPEQKEELIHLVTVAKEYERRMQKLLKTLAIVRMEAHCINLLTKDDWIIASKYRFPGFWGSHTEMIVNGYDISEFAHSALLQLAEQLPDLFKASGVTLDPLPETMDGEGVFNVLDREPKSGEV
jgi:hypothetical protein